MKMSRDRFTTFVSVAALGAALCLSCSSTPTSDIHVRSAVDAKSNIAAYKAYAWDTNAGLLHDRTGMWTPKDIDPQAEVKFLVDKKLRERGMTEVQQSPDLLVLTLIVADVKDVEEIKAKGGEPASKLDLVGKGALVVELVDAETAKTIWLGAAEGDVRYNNSVEVSKERLAYAVDKLFDQLPH